MTMESWMRFCSRPNISGASQQNSDAALLWTTEEDGDFLLKHQNKTWLHGSIQLILCNKSLQNLKIPSLFETEPQKVYIYTLTCGRACGPTSD